ncbi:MAG: TonB-dependent receptor [Saprospiraceae bacterium]|nr:TonB-dependent receptor [Saprospiraceae bacterium]
MYAYTPTRLRVARHFICLSFLLFLLPLLGLAQKGKILGKVIDDQTGAPLSYATIQIYQQSDGSLLTGGITDEAGLFTLESPMGDLKGAIDFIGYQTFDLGTFVLSPSQKTMDFGTIRLQAESSTLDEVVVQAEKSSMELALDKRVFNVGKDLGNAGGSAVEILNNIPSVTVDGEGNVKLRGASNVRILVDGKPSGLVSFKGGSGLQQLQASMVEKVEVITNPSARYEAEGMAGIINIVLKKDRNQGFNGSFETTLGYPTNLGGAANVNYRHNKVNFFVNYGINYRIIPSINMTHQEVYVNDTTFVSDQSYDGEHVGFFNNIRGGLDYFFNEQNILTASYLYSASRGKRLTDLRYDDYIFNTLTSYTTRTQDEDEIEPISEYVVSYKKLFDKKGHEFNAEVRYLDHWEDSDQVFEQQSFFPDGSSNLAENLLQTSLNDETERQLLLQLDYVQPFGKEGKLETGVRSTFRRMTNDYIVSEENEAGQLIPIPGLDNNFIYDENINAVYGILGDKKNAFSYQLGLRVEWTDIETILEETNQSNPRNYANLFPSAHFTYDLGEADAMQLSYSRRVRRPVYRDLSPFITFSDNRNFFSGNPDLNPEFSDVIELGHIKYFEKGSIASTLYYRWTDDYIEMLRSVDDQGFSNTRPENLNFEQAYGLEFSSSYTPYRWWKVDFNFNLFRSEVDGSNINADFTNTTTSWFVRKTSRFNVSSGAFLQLRANYEAPINTAQGKRKELFFLDLAYNREIFKGKGRITINITDVFNSKKIRTISRGDNFIAEKISQRIRRQINLTLSYRLKQS